MDQNQTSNDDLQKAIDDITNTTNVDPVFSDPVAAPSSVPEGDTGELSDPVGPFPNAKIKLTPSNASPITPPDPLASPEKTLAKEPALPEPPATPASTIPELPPLPAEPPIPIEPQPKDRTQATATNDVDTQKVKEAALRDLVPLLDKLTLEPIQKFNLYRDIFESLRDYSVLDPAYQAAKAIPDETKRAEALLYLIESIDKM